MIASLAFDALGNSGAWLVAAAVVATHIAFSGG
jgi:hypothetical protein